MRAVTSPKVPFISSKNVLSILEQRKLILQITAVPIKKSISAENSKSFPDAILKSVGYISSFVAAVYAIIIKQICLELIFILFQPQPVFCFKSFGSFFESVHIGFYKAVV